MTETHSLPFLPSSKTQPSLSNRSPLSSFNFDDRTLYSANPSLSRRSLSLLRSSSILQLFRTPLLPLSRNPSTFIQALEYSTARYRKRQARSTAVDNFFYRFSSFLHHNPIPFAFSPSSISRLLSHESLLISSMPRILELVRAASIRTTVDIIDNIVERWDHGRLHHPQVHDMLHLYRWQNHTKRVVADHLMELSCDATDDSYEKIRLFPRAEHDRVTNFFRDIETRCGENAQDEYGINPLNLVSLLAPLAPSSLVLISIAPQPVFGDLREGSPWNLTDQDKSECNMASLYVSHERWLFSLAWHPFLTRIGCEQGITMALDNMALALFWDHCESLSKEFASTTACVQELVKLLRGHAWGQLRKDLESTVARDWRGHSFKDQEAIHDDIDHITRFATPGGVAGVRQYIEESVAAMVRGSSSL